MRLVFYGDMSDFARSTSTRPRRGALDDVLAGLRAGRRRHPVRVPGAAASAFTNFFADFLANTAPDIEASSADDSITTLISWSASILGAWFVWNLYAAPGRSAALRQRFGVMTTAADHKFYWDELYDTSPTGRRRSSPPVTNRVVEDWIIGGSVKATAFVVGITRPAGRRAQTGVVREYAVAVVAGRR